MGKISPANISIDPEFLRDQRQRAADRAARFAAEAASPPPPLPKRTMAWPGGKVTTNKSVAVDKYLERKGDELTDSERARLVQS